MRGGVALAVQGRVEGEMTERTPYWQREWEQDCMQYRGRVLTGKYGHRCWDWDQLPIDETCEEWPCACAADLRREVEQ